MLTLSARNPGPNHGALLPKKAPPPAILVEIEAFAREHGISAYQICTRATNNSALLYELRAGRIPRPHTVDRLRTFMREYRR